MSQESVTVETGSTSIDSKKNETSCTILVVGNLDHELLNAIDKASISLVDSHVEIKDIGTARRYKVVIIGDAVRCSSVVRAIEDNVKGELEAMLIEIGLANALLEH